MCVLFIRFILVYDMRGTISLSVHAIPVRRPRAQGKIMPCLRVLSIVREIHSLQEISAIDMRSFEFGDCFNCRKEKRKSLSRQARSLKRHKRNRAHFLDECFERPWEHLSNGFKSTEGCVARLQTTVSLDTFCKKHLV